jgi:hypothetical protein
MKIVLVVAALAALEETAEAVTTEESQFPAFEGARSGHEHLMGK